MVDVSVIIVSFNTKQLTVQCIESIVDSIGKLNYEIIVIDNSSSDGSVEELRKTIKGNRSITGKLIENKDNVGFSRANNQGIKIAKGKYILLLNSDTKIKGNAIEKLINVAERIPDAGVVGPRLLNPDGSIQPSAFRFPTISRAIKQYWFDQKGLLDKYIPTGYNLQPTSVEALVMAAFLITPIALKEVGLLNERYFMFYEDFDFCKRVNNAGLKIYFLPSAEVIHYHGASGKSLVDSENQWKRLIPSSKIYHGTVKHYIFNFILWSGQKWKKLLS